MARKYLVTGGTGFIGSALVRRLLNDDYTVRVLDDNSRGALRRLTDIAGAFEFIEADVRDFSAVTGAAEGMDGIIHLSAVNGTEFFYTNPELVLDVGVRGMLSVVDACRANGIDDLVFASSSEVYQVPPVVPTDETVPLSVPDVTNARYSYGGSKIISELIALNYGMNGFERVTIFRPHNVYGPDMGWEHVLPQFALRAAAAVKETPSGPVPFRIQGDGSQTRAFVHINDFIDGLIKVIEAGGHREIYNIGNSDEVAIAEIARLVVAHFGREADLSTSPEPSGATPRRCPDISKLMALGYAPRLSLTDGLPSLIEWYRENSHLKPASNQKLTGSRPLI